jgi:hypothetical protein
MIYIPQMDELFGQAIDVTPMEQPKLTEKEGT